MGDRDVTDPIEQIFGADGLFASRFPGYEPRPQQVELSRFVHRGMTERKHVLGEGPTGSGKCLQTGTKVLRYDGQIVPVEDVRVGDDLMGPDSEPRRVLSTTQGTGPLMRIIPIKGDSWVCNDAHILTLSKRRSATTKERARGKHRSPSDDTIVDMAVMDYVNSSITQKHMMKLFQPSRVDFQSRDCLLPVDPYFLGVWLGDGSKTTTERQGVDRLSTVVITKPDAEIEHCCREEAAKFGLVTWVGTSQGRCPTYHMVRPGGNAHGADVSKYDRHNMLLNALRDLMGSEIRVPERYLHGSRATRTAVLAGLLDTDGYLMNENGGYEIVQRRVAIADDIAFLARTLGFRVTCREKIVDDKIYQRLFLSGDSTCLPMRIPRKIANPRQQIKDHLRTGFMVEPHGVGEFHGFTLDRDGRFLLGDFTVTHNSMAYFVPATWHAANGGRRRPRTVVVTATIALQQQIAEKDLPLLASIAPWEFSHALLKGRGNFACLAQVAKREKAGAFDAPSRETRAIADWARRTQTGDKADLGFVPDGRAWADFSVESDGCAGQDCWMVKHCYSEAARKAAFRADVIVTNYHLFFLHLQIKRLTGKDLVLPEFDFVVMDEAHESPDCARSVLGEKIGEKAVKDVAVDVQVFAVNWRGALERFDDAWRVSIWSGAEGYFSAVEKHRRSGYKGRLKGAGFAPYLTPGAKRLVGDLGVALVAIGSAAEELALKKERQGDLDESDAKYLTEARSIERRLEKAVSALRNAAEPARDENFVWAIEGDGKRPRLTSQVLDVSEVLRTELYDRTKSVVAVSATATVAGSFSFLRGELGAPEGTLELAVESPFDFGRQAAFYLPSDDVLPSDPKHPEHFACAIEETAKVVELCGGRTLVLCTSNADKDKVGAELKRRFAGRFAVLVQGERAVAELTREFKANETSILVGVRSFWTGVDVPGDALRGLVVWRLPITPPDDPVLDALCERDARRAGVKDGGYAGFLKHFLPRAVMLFRQGIGRLVRSRSDFGVVAVMDRRIVEKAYGRLFTESLPHFAGPFFDAGAVAGFVEAAGLEFGANAAPF